MRFISSIARRSIAAIVFFGLACGGGEKEADDDPVEERAPTQDADVEKEESRNPQVDEATDQEEAQVRRPVPAWLKECFRRAPGAPIESLASLLEHVNSLPRPTTLPCVLASLPRPFGLRATTNTLSSQPAGGPDAPRLLLRSGNLLIGTAPGGVSREKLELSEWISDGLSVKGDLWFPIPEGKVVTTADLFDRLELPGGSTPCGSCHFGESSAAEAGFPASAYASAILKPAEDSLVPLSRLVQIKDACRAMLETGCQILHAVFFRHRPADFDDLPGMQALPSATKRH